MMLRVDAESMGGKFQDCQGKKGLRVMLWSVYALVMPRTERKPLFKRSGEMSEEEREHLTRIGKRGGKSKSDKKLRAIKKNLRKAMAKRFPNSPKWRMPSS